MNWVAIDALAAIALLAIAAISLRRFHAYRRTLPIFAEWQVFKSRIPRYVRFTEMVLQIIAWVFMWLVLVMASLVLRYRFHPNASDTPALIVLACAIGAYPVAMLLANAVALAIPPLRRANVRAMAGLTHASLGRAMKELAMMAIVVMPVCAIAAVLGALEPRLT